MALLDPNARASLTLIILSEELKGLKSSDRLLLVRLLSQTNRQLKIEGTISSLSEAISVPKSSMQRQISRLIKAKVIQENYSQGLPKHRTLELNSELFSAAQRPCNEVVRERLSAFFDYAFFEKYQTHGLLQRTKQFLTANQSALWQVRQNKALTILYSTLIANGDHCGHIVGVTTKRLSHSTGLSLDYIHRGRRALRRLGLINVLSGHKHKGIMNRPSSVYLLRNCPQLRPYAPVNSKLVYFDGVNAEIEPPKIEKLFGLMIDKKVLQSDRGNVGVAKQLQTKDFVEMITLTAFEIAAYLKLRDLAVPFHWLSIPEELVSFYLDYANVVSEVINKVRLSPAYANSEERDKAVNNFYEQIRFNQPTDFLTKLSRKEQSFLKSLTVLICRISLVPDWEASWTRILKYSPIADARFATFPSWNMPVALLVTKSERISSWNRSIY